MSLLANEDGGVKPWVTYGLVALAIFAGAYFVRAAWTKSDRPNDIGLLCITSGCGYNDSRLLEIGESVPLKCPKCGKASVYATVNCPKCRTPNVWNVDRGLKGPTKCTKCGTEIIRGN